jgi:MoxR-like ATPase
MAELDHDPSPADPKAASLESARERFRGFFEELGTRFIERQDAIAQIGLALLAREHVLLTGPPGTAKSALSGTVLQNIVDSRSGQPSVFARQFTESTVQTDLIGSLDFKTLMESGRSEHFTDEGMLGAVHAFLDEVLDGRDNLLRATLNVLQERELKQGTKTTRGAIECALMTTNRYLSEVLEQSRDTLLAFVDRIAFVAFVPKSFADPANLVTVLGGQLGPKSRVPMPPLTIQDLDQLQELVGYVRFPESVSGELVGMLGRLETELAAAVRADPKFVPTRYLSTRTVVRTARILRAVVVFDWAMRDPSRPLCVRASDFQLLRLTLLLGGPALESVASLLQREPDARERRQLSIYQTERQVFERVVGEVTDDAIRSDAPRPEVPSLSQIREQPVERQIESCQQLLTASEYGGRVALDARRELNAAMDVVAHRLLSRALHAGIGEDERDHAVGNLERVARLLDEANLPSRELVPILRTRALEVLETQLEVSLTTSSGALADATRGTFALSHSLRYAKAATSKLEDHMRLRDALIAGGAVPREGSEQRWQHAIDRLLDELVQLWELGFDKHLVQAASKPSKQPLDALLAAIQKPLNEMQECGRWFVPLGKTPVCIALRVVDKKLMPFIARALQDGRYETREAVAQAIEQLLGKLDEADAHWAVSSSALIEWAARALLEVEPETRKRKKKETYSYDGYRQFRAAQPGSALAFSLVEVCSHIALASPELMARARDGVSIELVREQLSVLPRELVARLVEKDEARVAETLLFFRRWWDELTVATGSPEEQLSAIRDSRFHELLERESSLLRFALEAELLAQLFPDARETSQALKQELQSFGQAVQQHIHGLMHQSSLAAIDALATAGTSGGK